MRSIISTILIFFVLIAVAVEAKGGRRELSRIKLSHLIEDIERIKEINFGDYDEDNKKVSKSFDMECVKNFYKLPQNQKMMIYDAEDMIFTIGAALKCSDEEKTFETIYNKYIHDLWKERLSCIKWHLQQLEPTSKLIENFVISDDELKECKEFPIYEELSDLQEKIEFHFGPLNVYSCGAVSNNGANDFLKFLGKGAVIRYGNISEELRKSEKEKLREYFKDLVISTVNCVIKRFEDNPQAYLVNDTLNYYFIKQSIPTDPKETENDRYDYYKRLIKLEGVVDNDCIKEKLNLPKNGNLSLLKVEAKIIIASARSKCIRVSIEEYCELFMNFALWNIDRTEDLYSCSRYKLHKIQPTSKLVRNYVKDEKIEELCDSYNDHTYVYQLPMYSYYDYDSKLNETSCGVMSDEIVNVIKLKSILVFDEKDKDVRVSEAKNLFNYATDIFQKFADCILKRVRGE